MSSTDILLISPFPKAFGINEATIEPPIGLAYLAAVLEKAGFNCAIIDANILKIDNTALLDQVKKIRPQIIGISSNVVTVRSSIDLAKEAKAIFPDIPIILGGPFPTSLPLRTLELSSADAIVLGEGWLNV